jgi:DNA-directed RNA polymerase subunit RPC12/RpoP
MIGSGRTSGLAMTLVGIGIFLIGIVLLVTGRASGSLGTSGFVLGVLFFFIIGAPLVGGGTYMMVKGRQEVAEFAEVAKQKKILNMVLAQGQVRLAEAALELGMTRDQVEDSVRDLVGKGLFSGAINWKEGVLYSKEASQLKADRRCPNCGGELELAGKGVIRCPWCGSEVFLSQ